MEKTSVQKRIYAAYLISPQTKDFKMIRYFRDYDKLQIQQKKYVLDSLNIWASSGLLQIVRKSEGDCMLGNIKHGAAGVTGVKSGYVTLDKEEFDKEILLFKKFVDSSDSGLVSASSS